MTWFKKIKTGGIRGCAGGCAGCSGCGGGCCSSDPDEVKKMIEKCTVSKGADQDGKFNRLYVLSVCDRDCGLYCGSLYNIRSFSGSKKWQEKKNDEKFSMDNGEHKE